jgi:hypothetical protein
MKDSTKQTMCMIAYQDLELEKMMKTANESDSMSQSHVLVAT